MAEFNEYEYDAGRQFMDPASWKENAAGSLTRTLQAVHEETTIIIRKTSDDQYEPIVRYRGNNEQQQPCADPSTLEKAKENAWQYFRGCLLLDAAKPPASQDMTL